MTDTAIRRHANGSIDTGFYMNRGRVARSRSVITDLRNTCRAVSGAASHVMRIVSKRFDQEMVTPKGARLSEA